MLLNTVPPNSPAAGRLDPITPRGDLVTSGRFVPTTGGHLLAADADEIFAWLDGHSVNGDLRPLVAGRAFTAQDGYKVAPPAVVVSQSMAKRFCFLSFARKLVKSFGLLTSW